MNYYFVVACILFFYFNLWFLVSLVKKRNDVADIAWGLGFVLLAWSSFFLADETSWRGFLVCVVVSIWGVRLAWHIYKRNKDKTEDYRYLAWRRKWGKFFYLRSYLQVFLLQGFFLFLISLPILFVNFGNGPDLGWLDILGFSVWAVGFLFEAIGDAQLAKFIKNPDNKNKIMQSGLWAYTRHPNYFGEVVGWWGLWLVAASEPGGWVAFIGPLIITVLILKVSGIPMLEKKLEKNQDFIKYKQRVSVFFPLPPRK